MNADVDQMMEELQQLPVPVRAEIAYRLLTSLGTDDPEVHVNFDEELARRVEDIRSGRVVGIPLEQVMAELDSLDNSL